MSSLFYTPGYVKQRKEAYLPGCGLQAVLQLRELGGINEPRSPLRESFWRK